MHQDFSQSLEIGFLRKDVIDDLHMPGMFAHAVSALNDYINYELVTICLSFSFLYCLSFAADSLFCISQLSETVKCIYSSLSTILCIHKINSYPQIPKIYILLNFLLGPIQSCRHFDFATLVKIFFFCVRVVDEFHDSFFPYCFFCLFSSLIKPLFF